jgi:hypothetical protein
MSKNVFFHTISGNTIVCVSEPLQTITQVINGVEVTIRKQSNRVFGLLCIVDPLSGKTTDPTSLGLEEGQELTGFHFSTSPVIEQGDKGSVPKGEATGMFWVTATTLPEPKAEPEAEAVAEPAKAGKAKA